MTVGENNYDRINDYASVKISLARPHDIRSWSFGEVKSLKRLTIEPTVRKKTACSASVSSVLKRTGNVPVVNTAG